jgi:hypothetical protein
MSTSSYPVRVDASLQEDLSRWLWLFKWLLAIPHYLVLVLLWPAFFVLSVFAFVAILFTGHYPHRLFEFNVGVLRWSWRVAYYAYGGLGTDQYPPFTLADRPDYPAHLEIPYPDHLSRGLVLVKWWLLAIPHYLVIGLFLGTGWYAANGDFDSSSAWPGLVELLVLVAAIALLVTGRYPRGIFDLVLGLNRWVLRVAAYSALMTDAYPPFRLDLGGRDPGTDPALAASGDAVLRVGRAADEPATDFGAANPPGAGPVAPSQPTSQPPSQPTPPSEPPAPAHTWTTGRVVAAVLGSLLLLGSLGLFGGSSALWIADGPLRDGDGYLMSGDERIETSGHALVSEDVVIEATGADLPERLLGTVRLEAEATSGEVFVGVGPSSAVDDYLAGVAHSVVEDPVGEDGDAEYDEVGGGAPAGAPGDEDFWVATDAGAGQRSVSWDPDDGSWTLVVMRPDGSADVTADVAVGATVPGLDEIATGLLLAGLVVLTAAVALLYAALRPRQRD